MIDRICRQRRLPTSPQPAGSTSVISRFLRRTCPADCGMAFVMGCSSKHRTSADGGLCGCAGILWQFSGRDGSRVKPTDRPVTRESFVELYVDQRHEFAAQLDVELLIDDHTPTSVIPSTQSLKRTTTFQIRFTPCHILSVITKSRHLPGRVLLPAIRCRVRASQSIPDSNPSGEVPERHRDVTATLQGPPAAGLADPNGPGAHTRTGGRVACVAFRLLVLWTKDCTL